MVKRILTTFAGMVIGLICGAILGALIGGGLDIILGKWFGWKVLFGSVTGAATGLIAGTDVGLLGVRTRHGLEWLFFIVVIIPIGFLLFNHSWNWNDLLELTGIGALAGWLSVFVVKTVIARRLCGEPFQYWMTVGYLVLFAALMFIIPRLLLVMGLAIF